MKKGRSYKCNYELAERGEPSNKSDLKALVITIADKELDPDYMFLDSSEDDRFDLEQIEIHNAVPRLYDLAVNSEGQQLASHACILNIEAQIVESRLVRAITKLAEAVIAKTSLKPAILVANFPPLYLSTLHNAPGAYGIRKEKMKLFESVSEAVHHLFTLIDNEE